MSITKQIIEKVLLRELKCSICSGWVSSKYFHLLLERFCCSLQDSAYFVDDSKIWANILVKVVGISFCYQLIYLLGKLWRLNLLQHCMLFTKLKRKCLWKNRSYTGKRGRVQEVCSSVVFVCRQRTGASDYTCMPVQEFLKANFRKPSMWNNSFKVLTHEYCKRGGVLLELKKGFYCDFLDYTEAGRFRPSVRMSPLTVNFLGCKASVLWDVPKNSRASHPPCSPPCSEGPQSSLVAVHVRVVFLLCCSIWGRAQSRAAQQPLRCRGSRKHKAFLVVKEDSASQMTSLRINSQN